MMTDDNAMTRAKMTEPYGAPTPTVMEIDDIKAFLDKSITYWQDGITYWQDLDADGVTRAKHYADAYGTMLFVIFGVQE